MPNEIRTLPTDHLTEGQITGYCANELSPEETLRVTTHVADCERCREKLAAAMPLARATRAMVASLFNQQDRPEAHLDEEVLAAYTDNRLDEVTRELVEEHLVECASCREEEQELRSLFALVENIPSPVHGSGQPVSAREKFSTWISVRSRGQALQAGGLAFATGVIVFFITRGVSHTANQTALSAKWTSALQARERLVRQKEQDASDQLRQLSQQKQNLAASEKATEREREKIKAERLQIARARQNSESLPDPLQLEYAVLPNQGIQTLPLSGSSSDPLPFALYAPLPGATVLHDQVVFQWESVVAKSEQGNQKSAQSYQVEVTEGTGTDEKVKPLTSRVLPASPLLKTQMWKPEADFHLLPGRLYSWKVVAYRDNAGQDEMTHSPQRPLAIQFRTLALPTRKRLQAVPNSALRLSIALAQAGLLSEAKQTLATYLLAKPHDGRAQAWRQRIDRLQADRLRQVIKRLQDIPNSTGAQKMRAQVAAQLPEK